jgi:ethanolamine ammonia-lyase large subunit
MYLQYRRRKGDIRSEADILAEARTQIAEVRQRGVFIAEGHGANPWDLKPELDQQVRFLYEDAKASIFAELPAAFAASISQPVPVQTQSKDREDYILHPPMGELLSDDAEAKLRTLRDSHAGRYDVQIVISEGLNAWAITDEGHLAPYLEKVRADLTAGGYKVAPEHIIVTSGRVRAGYRIGELLFGSLSDRTSRRAILHVIGERPGSGHHAYSVYITAPAVETWAQAGETDHNITRVISGIADTALLPTAAATETLNILRQMAPR